MSKAVRVHEQMCTLFVVCVGVCGRPCILMVMVNGFVNTVLLYMQASITKLQTKTLLINPQCIGT